VYLTAAVSGIVLALMPTRLMHAAEPNQEVLVTQAAEPSMPSESADIPVAATQPPAATEQPARKPEPVPARPKTRGRRSSEDRPAPITQDEAANTVRDHAASIVGDDTARDEVKLMSW
jgi:hypothetical protein